MFDHEYDVSLYFIDIPTFQNFMSVIFIILKPTVYLLFCSGVLSCRRSDHADLRNPEAQHRVSSLYIRIMNLDIFRYVFCNAVVKWVVKRVSVSLAHGKNALESCNQ